MSQATTTVRPDSTLGIWIAAIRPATLWAGAVPVIVAAALAHATGVVVGLASVAALAGALLIQVGTNLVNDYADFKTGADGPDRLGPARAAAQGWLSPRALCVGAGIALSGAALCGMHCVCWWLAATGDRHCEPGVRVAYSRPLHSLTSGSAIFSCCSSSVSPRCAELFS